MSYYEQQHGASAYPPPGQPYPPQSYPPTVQSYVAPPPAGYPTNDNAGYPPQGPVETKEKGEGFWKGCCAALCCCCLLDACF